MRFRELGVDPQLDVVIVVMAEPKHKRDLFIGRLIMRYDASPFNSMEEFGRMEAAGRNVSVAQQRFAEKNRSESLGSIVEYRNVALLCDRFDCLNITRIAVYLDRQDRFSVWGNGCLNLGRIDAECICLNIHEYRLASFP